MRTLSFAVEWRVAHFLLGCPFFVRAVRIAHITLLRFVCHGTSLRLLARADARNNATVGLQERCADAAAYFDSRLRANAVPSGNVKWLLFAVMLDWDGIVGCRLMNRTDSPVVRHRPNTNNRTGRPRRDRVPRRNGKRLRSTSKEASHCHPSRDRCADDRAAVTPRCTRIPSRRCGFQAHRGHCETLRSPQLPCIANATCQPRRTIEWRSFHTVKSGARLAGPWKTRAFLIGHRSIRNGRQRIYCCLVMLRPRLSCRPWDVRDSGGFPKLLPRSPNWRGVRRPLFASRICWPRTSMTSNDACSQSAFEIYSQ